MGELGRGKALPCTPAEVGAAKPRPTLKIPLGWHAVPTLPKAERPSPNRHWSANGRDEATPLPKEPTRLARSANPTQGSANPTQVHPWIHCRPAPPCSQI
jgi:hypothetical protein